MTILITDLRYRPELCPNDDCAVAQIERENRVIGYKAMPTRERAEALRFLIHLIGDLHQPLRVDDYRGGNEVKVRIDVGAKGNRQRAL